MAILVRIMTTVNLTRRVQFLRVMNRPITCRMLTLSH